VRYREFWEESYERLDELLAALQKDTPPGRRDRAEEEGENR
jgi:hypothetical protein